MKKIILLPLLLAVSLSCFAPSTQVMINSHGWSRIITSGEDRCVQECVRVTILKLTLERMIQYECYHERNGRSHCNIFARDILDNRSNYYYANHYGALCSDFALDISSVFPTTASIFCTRIDVAYDRALIAAKRGLIQSLTMHEAFDLAARGFVIWCISKKYNHECIVYPDFRRWIPERGCRIAQAGHYNCIRDISHFMVFGKHYLDPDIKFYLFSYKKIG